MLLYYSNERYYLVDDGAGRFPNLFSWNHHHILSYSHGAVQDCGLCKDGVPDGAWWTTDPMSVFNVIAHLQDREGFGLDESARAALAPHFHRWDCARLTALLNSEREKHGRELAAKDAEIKKREDKIKELEGQLDKVLGKPAQPEVQGSRFGWLEVD